MKVSKLSFEFERNFLLVSTLGVENGRRVKVNLGTWKMSPDGAEASSMELGAPS